MPRSGFKIGRVFGIDIVINFTWTIIFFLLVVSLGDMFGYYSTHPSGYAKPFPGGIWPWVTSVITIAIFFACLIAHELSHSLVAKRHGVEVKRITLFLFGGVAEMTDEVHDPVSELKMAAAGPAASLLLAGIFFGLFYLTDFLVLSTAIVMPIGFLFVMNLMVGVFNLLPGFPMDGGRILRAILWKKTGDLRKSTWISTVIGKFIALAMIAFGLYLAFSGLIRGLDSNALLGGFWLSFIGVFLYLIANTSYKQTLYKLAATDTKVEDIMFTNVPAVDAETTLTTLRLQYFGPYRLPVLPITDGVSIMGIVSEKDLEGIAPAEWDVLNAGRIAKPVPVDKTVPPETPLTEALKKMSSFSDFVLVVSDNDILGILSKQELLNYFDMRIKLQKK